jgi:hypothetical protein
MKLYTKMYGGTQIRRIVYVYRAPTDENYRKIVAARLDKISLALTCVGT